MNELRQALENYQRICKEFRYGGLGDQLSLATRALQVLDQKDQIATLDKLHDQYDDFCEELYSAMLDYSYTVTFEDADLLEVVKEVIE